jgi:hypothetical protein
MLSLARVVNFGAFGILSAFRGTAHDVMLPAGDVATLLKWLSDTAAMDQLRKAALDSGLTPQEIDQGLARLRALAPLAQPVLLSKALGTHGRKLYAIALKPPK